MSCTEHDLKAYALNEATAAQRAAIERHLSDCASCREEFARLDLTRTALAAMEREEMPRRIAFVSDKVFEPRWYQRWFGGPAWGFASASVLAGAILVHALYRPPAVAPAPPATLTASQIEAQVERQVADRLEAAVKQAVADSEARQKAHLARTIERLTADQKAELLAVEENFNVLRKRLNLLQVQTASADWGVTR